MTDSSCRLCVVGCSVSVAALRIRPAPLSVLFVAVHTPQAISHSSISQTRLSTSLAARSSRHRYIHVRELVLLPHPFHICAPPLFVLPLSPAQHSSSRSVITSFVARPLRLTRRLPAATAFTSSPLCITSAATSTYLSSHRLPLRSAASVSHHSLHSSACV